MTSAKDVRIDTSGVLYTRATATVWRDSGDEVVVTRQGMEELDLLNPTASAVWHLLEIPRRLTEIVEHVRATYGGPPDDIGRDIGSLIQDLVARRLVDMVADAND